MASNGPTRTWHEAEDVCDIGPHRRDCTTQPIDGHLAERTSRHHGEWEAAEMSATLQAAVRSHCGPATNRPSGTGRIAPVPDRYRSLLPSRSTSTSKNPTSSSRPLDRSHL